MFDPTHTAANERLNDFVPHAGRDYASMRNYDDLVGVSTLSPYIRHRIITEEDVLRAALTRHNLKDAEKFVQEVYWRTYWKGWLELRPGVWANYKTDLNAALNRIQAESGLRQNWEAACRGDTGIDCFDQWAQQLTDTGYLHNHARMWFASIWIFTLKLPWTLGADFFFRHLLDGDPASNTLSWRWVAGLQTIGKTYLARPDNIARYTQGRFHPTGLATHAEPLEGLPHPVCGPVPLSDCFDPKLRTGLVITEEDLSLDWLLDQITPTATTTIQTTSSRSPLMVAPMVTQFVNDAMKDCTFRYREQLGPITRQTPKTLTDWARSNNLQQLITSFIPTGPSADALAGQKICQIVRPFDSSTWPNATHGFFRFKEKIPMLIGQIKELRLS